MKMKSLYRVLIMSGSLLLASCHGDLNVVQPSQFTSLSMWTEENDAVSAVNGVYTQFRATFATLLNIYGEMRTNWYESGSVNDAFFNRIGTNVLLSGDSGSNWNGIYTTINSANLILKHIPDMEFSNESTRNELMAHAYFIRAYCYFTLVRVFGDCPLLTSGFESEKQDDMYPYRNPASEVYEQVESDLQEASQLMPAESKQLYKASSAAINMLRTEFYLWKAKRLNGGNEAYQIAQSAINSVLNAGYKLLPSFGDIFDVNNKSNDKLIWSLPYIINENVTPGTSPNFFAYYLAPNELRTRLQEAGYSEEEVPAGSHQQYVAPTKAYCSLLTSDERDSRANISIRTFEDKFLTEEIQLQRMIVKFKGSYNNDTRSFDSDVPMYRIAEAYLLKAEVENALGNQTEAVKNINIVAKRAYGIDNYYSSMSKEEIEKTIIIETLKEFVGESKAWWTYLRLNKEFEMIESLKGRENEKNVTLWPIAPACLNTNPNIVQTEGYK